jgi:putative transposase
MTSNTTRPDSSQLEQRPLPNFSTIGLIRSRPRCGLGRVSSSKERLRGEFDAALSRPHYGRSRMAGSEGRAGVAGHRHGSRMRSLTGTFGPIEIIARAKSAVNLC